MTQEQAGPPPARGRRVDGEVQSYITVAPAQAGAPLPFSKPATYTAPMNLEIDVETPWPATPDWPALAHRAASAAAQVAPELGHPRLVASVLFTSDEDIRALNAEWRGKDKPTNVLSFPMLERGDLLDLAPEGPPEMLGDIALAHETCAREAAEKGISVADHAAHLLVHGLLHLAGYDHEIGDEEAEAMEALETKALAVMGLADPYGRHV